MAAFEWAKALATRKVKRKTVNASACETLDPGCEKDNNNEKLAVNVAACNTLEAICEKDNVNAMCMVCEEEMDVCPICCETKQEVLACEEFAGSFHSACSCAACHDCFARWIDATIPACRRSLQLRVQCFGCAKTIPQALVLRCSEQARELAENLERREQLQRNLLFPAVMQVECRRAECVGIGYLGYETIMCMICTEQWSAESESSVSMAHPGTADLDDFNQANLLSRGELARFKTSSGTHMEVRKCPKCGVIIEKNGGCDHMTCKLCKHEFYWSSGKNYRR